MIPDARKQAIIEGLFCDARSLPELRWLNAIFAHTLADFSVKAQLELSLVLQIRVDSIECGHDSGVPRDEDDAQGQLRTGPENAEGEPPAADARPPVLSPDRASSERPCSADRPREVG